MVIISNGFSKFHLSVAASEADKRKTLSSFLTGAYPTPFLRSLFALPYFRTNSKTQRLVARREQISDELVHPLFASEALHAVGILRHSDALLVDSFQHYGRSAVRYVKQAAARGAKIYHYRAGFGGESVDIARRLGMYTLCDHSIAHPAMVDALVNSMGELSNKSNSETLGAFWQYVLSDLEQADSILVNSDFVKETFEIAGHKSTPVHVIYLGVDDSFLDQVQRRKRPSEELSLLFAGSFEKRKGAEVIIAALESLDSIPWRLEVAGNLGSGLVERYRNFFSDSRVNHLGLLSRKGLARAMARAEVFVFPSLAEGSARVVFEALACGCYVITTPNSGSIVQNGVHGSIVAPGNSALLADALVYAYKHREMVSAVGKSNSICVFENYRQMNYGDKLSALYDELLLSSRFR
jgi:glycosyltransferase involved in cell wall biosynthesis